MIKTLILQTTFGQIFFSKETFFGSEAGDSDISLTAGLISAIYSMTEETQKQKITEIELEDTKSVFRELPGDRLFILTVENRMDNNDANELLADIIDGFFDKYGDIQPDGMILNDFEGPVDEIVAKRLWYNTTPPRLKVLEYLVLLTILFSVIWYPYWLLNARTTIMDPIFNGLNEGFLGFILAALLVLLGTVAPLAINIFLLGKFPTLKLPFRYFKEFFKRPTRGGYAEMLPTWFLVIPLMLMAGMTSLMIAGKGIVYAFSVQRFNESFVNARPVYIDGVFQFQLFWRYIAIYFVLYFLIWLVLFPVIVGLVTGNLNKNFLKSAMIVTSLAGVALLPGHLLAGSVLTELMGYNPNDAVQWATSINSLGFILIITAPINLFIWGMIFYLGMGINPLVRVNRGRFIIGFGGALFIVFQLLDLAWWLIFESGLLGFRVFIE
ncbi:MAG: hypothetical protein GPJ54_14645 [Candidatus Heimdallarchaeota archaeon]|nr:hypothetical protein [Candidatus Heimdallarchaeota archaeon]